VVTVELADRYHLQVSPSFDCRLLNLDLVYAGSVSLNANHIAAGVVRAFVHANDTSPNLDIHITYNAQPCQHLATHVHAYK
jgi:hypothetical protein